MQLMCSFWDRPCDWWAYTWGRMLPEAMYFNSYKISNLIILFNSLVILISFLRFNELDLPEIVLLQMSARSIETYKLKGKEL
jgi:hypothetical protein